MENRNLLHQHSLKRWLLRLVILVAPLGLAAQNPPAPAPMNWSGVEQIIGRKSTPSAGGVARFGFPRSDLHVQLDGVTIKPAFALGGWVAFHGNPTGEATAMGDLVLTEDEVARVMRSLQAAGVEQTALHNHLIREQPHVLYMHIHARGNAQTIARTIREALTQTKTPMNPPASAAPAPAVGIDTAAIAQTLKVTGKSNGGVYQVSVPRRETITENGMEVPASMGLGTAINFQPTSAGKAAITGDFVLQASEVNPVIKALRENGIEVTALHSHLLNEQPKLYFMHFWANDDAVKLARGLAAALDKTASKR